MGRKFIYIPQIYILTFNILTFGPKKIPFFERDFNLNQI